MNTETYEYKCKECGHVWTTGPPLFTSIHACEIQGCSGKAYPVEDDASPRGIQEAKNVDDE